MAVNGMVQWTEHRPGAQDEVGVILTLDCQPLSQGRSLVSGPRFPIYKMGMSKMILSGGGGGGQFLPVLTLLCAHQQWKPRPRVPLRPSMSLWRFFS